MKTYFGIFAAGFGLAVGIVALGMYGMDPGFISFTSPHEYWAIQAHRKQTKSTIFVVGQKDMRHISEFNQEYGLVVRDSGSRQLNEKVHMEVMNALQLSTSGLLREAHEEDIEPHVKEWIDKENETKIRGKKLYKKNIIPIIINKSLLYKERFGINIDGEWCTVCIKKLERTVDGLDEKSKLSCSGYLEDKKESSVVFTSRGDIVSGHIRTPDESYTITPGPENKSGQRDAFRIHIVGKIDQGAFAGADH